MTRAHVFSPLVLACLPFACAEPKPAPQPLPELRLSSALPDAGPPRPVTPARQTPQAPWPLPAHPDWTPAPLGPRAVPWAHYLNAMHKRLHPLFTDEYLSALDRAPPGDPRNDPGLVVLLQLVVDPTGALHEVRVAKPSGVQSFDADAARAFSRAAPFAPPPPVLRSPDGNAYVSWALFRDPVYGCSTMTTHPYIFEAPPKP